MYLQLHPDLLNCMLHKHFIFYWAAPRELLICHRPKQATHSASCQFCQQHYHLPISIARKIRRVLDSSFSPHSSIQCIQKAYLIYSISVTCVKYNCIIISAPNILVEATILSHLNYSDSLLTCLPSSGFFSYSSIPKVTAKLFLFS